MKVLNIPTCAIYEPALVQYEGSEHPYMVDLFYELNIPICMTQ